jgi:peptidoglycan/xylan/chitin deacetylase (PgdA/CDA1 family)
MMRYPGRKIMRRVLRPIERRFFPGAIVLGYHRVADDSWDPLGLQVSAGHFAAQLEELQSLRTVISLQELVERHAAREALDRYAVLTFDDGYSDFAKQAIPIAIKAGAPVTVFVTSGCTGNQFWWEELTALLAPRGQGGAELDISLGASEAMRFTQLHLPDARAAAVNVIGARLSCADRGTRELVLQQVRLWAGPEFRPSVVGFPMDAAALADVARHENVEIGGHTVSHCCLERLGLDEQRREIEQNKIDLEQLCGKAVRALSYPSGSLSARTPRLVEEVGYSCACTSRDGTVSRHTDPFRIPRIWVPNISGPDFRCWLGSWVSEARG